MTYNFTAYLGDKPCYVATAQPWRALLMRVRRKFGGDVARTMEELAERADKAQRPRRGLYDPGDGFRYEWKEEE